MRMKTNGSLTLLMMWGMMLLLTCWELLNPISKRKEVVKLVTLWFISKEGRIKMTISLWDENIGSKKGDFAFIKNIKSAEKLPDNLDYDSIVFKNALNEYYLCIPQVLDVRGENQAPKHSGCVVALDPGIITFQSTFDTNGYVSKWGTGDVKRITRLCLVHDKLQSKWTLTNHKKRYKYKKAGRRIQKKIRNLVDDLHKKLCLWLCRNYRAILLPSFETKSLKVDKETRQTISA